MAADKYPGYGQKYSSYDYDYFMEKFKISKQEVAIAIKEIHMGSPEELEEYIKLKYKS